MIDRPLLGPKHILIVGCDELGATVTRELVEHGNTVHVLDRTPRAFEGLPESAVEERRILPFVGDGTSHQDLIRAGIREVDVFMSLTSSDTANILSAQAAKQVFSVEVVVCRVDDRALQSMYEEMGLITIGATSLLFDIAVHSATA